MARNTAVTLDDDLERFVDAELSAGRFGSLDDMVAAGLRLLDDEASRSAALKAAIDEGEASGYVDDFDVQAFLEWKKRNAA